MWLSPERFGSTDRWSTRSWLVAFGELPFGLLSFLGDDWNAAADTVEKGDDLKEAKELDEMENEMELDAGAEGDLLDAANEFEAKEFGDVTDDLDVNELAEDGNRNGAATVRLLAT